MARGNQRNSFANESWDDMDDELIQLSGVQQRSNKAGSAHHPNVLAGRRSQTARKIFDRFVHESHIQFRLRWFVREDVVFGLRQIAFHTLLVELQTLIVSFSSKQYRID